MKALPTIAMLSLVAAVTLPVAYASITDPAGTTGDAAVAGVNTRVREFRYQAFVGPAEAGEATVRLELSDTGYEVSGRAKAKGLVQLFSEWRTEFLVRGLMDKGKRLLQSFWYFERAPRKAREVKVENGELHVVKNGKPRAAKPAPPGDDMLSALFVHPRCEEELELNTGRKQYHLQRTSEHPQRCDYEITRGDGDRYNASVEFGTVDELRVPVRILLRGSLSGRLELVDAR